ncbi:hypothetical protein HPB48_000279 [Haemaphysalis longicornis]|uniref:Tick transposon n=1 Tax=Haemaphysalis longicornis TaxID=44386 RepID=A0A9J6GCK2_HAELO|nr:hypothetical protein HPB48_000279 [Haemaphysalis longicornis]
MKVRAYISPGKGASVDVVYDVDVSIQDADLPILIKPATEGANIKQGTRLGKSRCVKLVFQGDCIPAHVKVGHFRHAVRPFVPKPLQCHKCLKIGHVSSVCGRATVCSKCSGSHDAKACTVGVLKCANCQGTHDASSKTCSRLKEEQKILKQMIKDHSSHKDASAKVRRRRRSRRPVCHECMHVFRQYSAFPVAHNVQLGDGRRQRFFLPLPSATLTLCEESPLARINAALPTDQSGATADPGPGSALTTLHTMT